MSITISVQVTCDSCETYFLDDIEAEEDVEEAIQNAGGTTDVEVNGNYLEHLCEDCAMDLYYCEECDSHMWSGDAYMCADFTTCAECTEGKHEEAQQNGEIEVEDGFCTQCDYEFAAPPKNVVREPLVLL